MEQTIVPGPPEAMSTVSPSLDAGIALAAIPVLNRYGLPAPTPAAVVAATGASKTTAYKVRSALLEHLPSALQPPGRPPKPPRPEPAEHGLLTEVLRRVLGFVCDHPGSVSGSAAHRSYADSFHCFVLELCGEQQELTLDQLADATTVPLGTLKDWLRGELSQVDAPEPGSPPAATLLPAVPQIETVLLAWANWEGAFRPFCEHVQLDLRVPFTRAHIADILEAEGVRIPKRRGRRQPDASAMKGAFETFFPGAQWVGDGTELTIDLWGHRFSCNLELDVDAASGAFPGASIRPTEDSAAVVEAFVDGVATTGEPPLALLLDNKPSNHAEAVNDALGDTLLMRPRPYTPTDKPHVEGAFGLFAQEAPPLRITADDPGELARQIIALVVTTWLRAVNHRPRADREASAESRSTASTSPPTTRSTAPRQRSQSAYASWSVPDRPKPPARTPSSEPHSTAPSTDLSSTTPTVICAAPSPPGQRTQSSQASPSSRPSTTPEPSPRVSTRATCAGSFAISRRKPKAGPSPRPFCENDSQRETTHWTSSWPSRRPSSESQRTPSSDSSRPSTEPSTRTAASTAASGSSLPPTSSATSLPQPFNPCSGSLHAASTPTAGSPTANGLPLSASSSPKRFPSREVGAEGEGEGEGEGDVKLQAAAITLQAIRSEPQRDAGCAGVR